MPVASVDTLGSAVVTSAVVSQAECDRAPDSLAARFMSRTSVRLAGHSCMTVFVATVSAVDLITASMTATAGFATTASALDASATLGSTADTTTPSGGEILAPRTNRTTSRI